MQEIGIGTGTGIGHWALGIDWTLSLLLKLIYGGRKLVCVCVC